MNNVSDKRDHPNDLADRIAGFDDPSMGDERERDVILRAYTLGAVVSTYVFFSLGLIFALFGAGMWSVLIVLGSMVTSIVISAYCKRENVDFSIAMARVSPRRLILGNIVGAVFAIVWVGAIVFHMSNGYPLIDVDLGGDFSRSSSSYSIVFGAAFGFIAAITMMTISRTRKIKQVRAEAAVAADIEDED